MATRAEAEELLELEALAWPITIRYQVRTDYGDTSQELTVDVPALQGAYEPSWKLGEELWRRAVAPATSGHAELIGYDTVLWKLAPAAIPTPVYFCPGGLSGAHGPRTQQGCLVLHTGHLDRRARRRFHLPAIPASWHEGGLLTPSGLRALDGWGKTMFMGLNGEMWGGPFAWYIAYPEALPATAANGNGVAFRRVAFVRSCWHTAQAPELSQSPWP